jgi:hypothetical protein
VFDPSAPDGDYELDMSNPCARDADADIDADADVADADADADVADADADGYIVYSF